MVLLGKDRFLDYLRLCICLSIYPSYTYLPTHLTAYLLTSSLLPYPSFSRFLFSIFFDQYMCVSSIYIIDTSHLTFPWRLLFS